MKSPTGANRESRLEEFLAAPKKAVWTIALPMMGAFAVHAVYNVVDTAFIGRLGAQALAGATYVVALIFVAIALTNGLSAGVTATIAQAVGRGDGPAADAAASQGLTIALLLGVALALTGLSAGHWVIPLLGARGESATFAWHYFQLVAAGMPLFFLTGLLRAVLTGEGDAKTPMLVIAGTTVINLVLDPILIFVVGLGIRGAALATICAQLTSGIVLALMLKRRERAFARIRFSLMLPRGHTARTIIAIGLPATVAQLLMAFGMGMNNWLLAGFSQMSVAGYGAGSRVDLLVALPMLGLAGGAMAVIGMFAGAGRPDLVRSTALYTYRAVVLVALTFGLSAYLASDWILALFTKDLEATAVGKQYLGYMIFAYPMMAFGMTTGRILQGIGLGLPTLIITIVRVPLIGVGGAWLAVMAFNAPIHFIWSAIIAGGATANVISFFWVRKRVFRDDPTALVRARSAAQQRAGGTPSD